MSIFQEEGKTRGKDTFQVLCLVLSGKQDVFRILHREVLFKKYLFGRVNISHIHCSVHWQKRVTYGEVTQSTQFSNRHMNEKYYPV